MVLTSGSIPEERSEVKTITDTTFLRSRIEAEYEDEEITIWNSLTVIQTHNIRHGRIETEYKVYAGNGSGRLEPDYITESMKEKLETLDIHNDFEVLDPNDDDVIIL